MPVYDADTSVTSNASITSISVSHSASGANRWAKIAASWFGDTAHTPMTYAGGGGTPSTLWTTGADTRRTAVAGVIGPATGAQTVQITWPIAVTDVAFGATSYTDVHQTTPTGTAATATGSSTAPSVAVSSASGELVTDFCRAFFPANSVTPDASQTIEWEVDNFGGSDSAAWASHEAGASSVTMSGSLANSAPWAIGGISLKPAAAGGATGTLDATLGPLTLVATGELIGEPVVQSQPRGGDDAPRHPGWNRKRAKLKLKKDEDFTASIRSIYRELTAAPETRERAEDLVAPPIVERNDETPRQYAARLAARENALRAEKLRLDRVTTESEIALRLLYRELRELQERDDEDVIGQLLAQVL